MKKVCKSFAYRFWRVRIHETNWLLARGRVESKKTCSLGSILCFHVCRKPSRIIIFRFCQYGNTLECMLQQDFVSPKNLDVAFSLLSPFLSFQFPHLNSSRVGKEGRRDATECCTVQFTAELWKVGSAITAKSRKPSQSEANKETIVAVGRYDPRPNKTYNLADNLNRPLVNQILLFKDRKSFFFPSCFHFTESTSLSLWNVSLVTIIVRGFSLDFWQTKNGKRQE